MTVQVGIVNLLLETHGGSRRQGDATWYLLIFDYLSDFGVLFSTSPLQTQAQVDFIAIFVPGKRNTNLL
jgi:hypothetical protein